MNFVHILGSHRRSRHFPTRIAHPVCFPLCRRPSLSSPRGSPGLPKPIPGTVLEESCIPLALRSAGEAFSLRPDDIPCSRQPFPGRPRKNRASVWLPGSSATPSPLGQMIFRLLRRRSRDVVGRMVEAVGLAVCRRPLLSSATGCPGLPTTAPGMAPEELWIALAFWSPGDPFPLRPKRKLRQDVPMPIFSAPAGGWGSTK